MKIMPRKGGKNKGSSSRVRVKKRVLSFEGMDPLKLFGERECHLQILEEKYPGRVVVRGDEIILQGSDREIRDLTDFFSELIDVAGRKKVITEQDFRHLLVGGGERVHARYADQEAVVAVVTRSGHSVRPRSLHQKEYLDAIAAHDIVFAIGPAGTGKTYLAVASAVAALKRKEIDRIVLVRPVVEAGESLGFCREISRRSSIRT